MPTTLESVVTKYLRSGKPAQRTREEYSTTLRKWSRWNGAVAGFEGVTSLYVTRTLTRLTAVPEPNAKQHWQEGPASTHGLRFPTDARSRTKGRDIPLDRNVDMTVRHCARTKPSQNSACHPFDVAFRQIEVASVDSTAASNADFNLRAGDATSELTRNRLSAAV